MTRLPASALRPAPTLSRATGGASVLRSNSMPSQVLQRAQAPAQMVLPLWGPLKTAR